MESESMTRIVTVRDLNHHVKVLSQGSPTGSDWTCQCAGLHYLLSLYGRKRLTWHEAFPLHALFAQQAIVRVIHGRGVKSSFLMFKDECVDSEIGRGEKISCEKAKLLRTHTLGKLGNYGIHEWVKAGTLLIDISTDSRSLSWSERV